jgi:hypothetical protein
MSGSVLHAAIAPQRQAKIAEFEYARQASLRMGQNDLEQPWRLAARSAARVYALLLLLGVGVGVVPAEERQ